MKQLIYIIGAGGLGREIAAVLTQPEMSKSYILGGFIDDALPKGTVVNSIVVAGNMEWLVQQAPVLAVIAV